MMLPAPHAHLQSVFVVIILSHDGRLKGILSLLSRQHHQRSHGQDVLYSPMHASSQQTECAGAVIHQKWHAAVHTHPG